MDRDSFTSAFEISASTKAGTVKIGRGGRREHHLVKISWSSPNKVKFKVKLCIDGLNGKYGFVMEQLMFSGNKDIIMTDRQKPFSNGIRKLLRLCIENRIQN